MADGRETTGECHQRHAVAAALANLAAETAALDTELICVHAEGRADFHGLLRQMRLAKPDKSPWCSWPLDILFERDVGLRRLPLADRLRDLETNPGRVEVFGTGSIRVWPDGVR
jgi:ATP-dependent DNA ligase